VCLQHQNLLGGLKISLLPRIGNILRAAPSGFCNFIPSDPISMKREIAMKLKWAKIANKMADRPVLIRDCIPVAMKILGKHCSWFLLICQNFIQ
jgi:hypothetical protein